MDTKRQTRLMGWLCGAAATLLYLLTMEPDVSFWDCGEFITTSYGFMIGHPPGAPFYQLMAHVFTLFSFGNPAMVAWCSNLLSVIAGGVTAMMLFWSLAILLRNRRHMLLGAFMGTACYVLCDTAWFSAVESEVYSLSMALSATMIWAMLRWAIDDDRQSAWRWILLISLLLGLSVCVHQLGLLTTPALLLIFILSKRNEWKRLLRTLPLIVLFFVIGLSPYLIIPICSNANPPINECRPQTYERFKSYVNRDMYEKAPMWPRRWRERDADHARLWSSKGGEWEYLGSYQMWYMYGRYLMWNFSGRYNDRMGYGTMMNGQFVTGIPFVDRGLVGTSSKMPKSLPYEGHNNYLMLPLLLGLVGFFSHLSVSKRGFWTVLALFLTGGIILNLYLNHPCYEPRERDYAYVLSFFAFAIWIGVGATVFADKCAEWAAGRKNPNTRKIISMLPLLLLVVPALMGWQNYDDHDRSGRHIAADTAHNLLNGCDEGAILFTNGDNDTFPLWFAQHVEGYRTDVSVVNIVMVGGSRAMIRRVDENEGERPIYFTHYAQREGEQVYGGRLALTGNTYRLLDEPADSVLTSEAYRHVMNDLHWRSTEGMFVDDVSCRFLEQYWKDMLLIAENLIGEGDSARALDVVHKAMEIPLDKVQDPMILCRLVKVLADAGSPEYPEQMRIQQQRLKEELDYFATIDAGRRRYIAYTILPRQAAQDTLTALNLRMQNQ